MKNETAATILLASEALDLEALKRSFAERDAKIGVIGLGSMGTGYMKHLAESDRWDVVAACDLSEERLGWARETYPGIETTKRSADIITRADLDAVGIFTLADIRPQLIEQALKHGKHVLAEKPIADSIPVEKELLSKIEASDRIVAVNIFSSCVMYNIETKV